ncbi:MAG: M20/M25/M40 family metallo-hydrolase [Phycisphaeraceae bacterium]|nr:M20/M25/M40 family metallo-hydrolase [Phycisphaeraceae bacterium]
MKLSRFGSVFKGFWAGVVSIAGLWVIGGFAGCVLMPGDRTRGVVEVEKGDVPRAERLRRDVERLAGEIGERSLMVERNGRPSLYDAEDCLALSLAKMGFVARWQTFAAACPDGVTREASNLEVEIAGSTRAEEIIVVGAHYDTVHVDDMVHGKVRTPGADDNASGCAALLEIARGFAARRARGEQPGRTVRLVFFANEEPPFFWTDQMGSLVYARACKERGEKIAGMISLETIGMFSDELGSQGKPALMGNVVPDRGDFIAFVGMSSAEGFVRACVEAFRAGSSFPCEGAALPMAVPRVGSSDHWSFWKQGYPAVMVTDTAKYRNRNYHKETDSPETLNYEKMAEVVKGLEEVVKALAEK